MPNLKATPPIISTPKKFTEALGLTAILGVGLFLRLVNYFEIKANDPYFSNLTVDPKLYHEWALRINAGDWLGSGTFNLSPLYPYVLAMAYKIFGSGFEVGHILNVVLGTISVGLIWLLARTVFGWRQALVAAFFAATYPMFIYVGCDLALENIQIPLNALLLIILWHGLQHGRFGLLALAGLLLALSTLARPNVLAFAPFALGCIALARMDDATWRSILYRCSAFSLGLVVGLAPCTARNWFVADDLILVTDSGGINFYIGNNAEANGYFNVPNWITAPQFGNPNAMHEFATNYAQEKVGHQLKASEVSKYWNGMAWNWIAQNPWQATQLLAKKSWLLFSSNEVGVMRQLVLDQEFSSVLRLPLPGFSVVIPLGLIGIAISIRQWRRFVVLNAFLCSQIFVLVLFFISDRHRLPMGPAIIAFAGFATIWLFDCAHNRRWIPFMLGAATALLLFFGTLRPNDSTVTSSNFFNLGNKLRDQGRLEEACAQYQLAIQMRPQDISAHNNLALLMERGQQSPEAIITEWEIVLQLAKATKDAVRIERAQRHLLQLRGHDARIPVMNPADSAP